MLQALLDLKTRNFSRNLYVGFFTCGVSYIAEAVRGCILFIFLKSETLLLSSLQKRAAPTWLKRFIIKVIPAVNEIETFLCAYGLN